MSKSEMTSKAAARIQNSALLSNGGKTPKGSFASRAQRAASKGKK